MITGANYALLKIIVPHIIHPNAIVLIRIGCGAAFFSVLSYFYSPSNVQIAKKDILVLILCGITGVAGNQFFFYQGMKITTPINGAIFNLINPITIVALSYILLNERITKVTLLGLCMSLCGALLLLDFQEFYLSATTFWGDIMVLINAIFFGCYVVLVTPLVIKYNPFIIAKWSFICGFILFLPVGYNSLLETNWSGFDSLAWWILAYIILLTTLFVYFLNNLLPRLTSPYIIGFYVYFQPFVASVVAVMVGRDILTFRKIMCGLLIIAGIFIAQYSRNKNLGKRQGEY